MAKKILIVDDSATVRQQVRVFLSSNGYEVAEADNGQSGLAKARTTAMDLIISDVNMPVMDGIAMVRELRKLPSYAKTPVFILTTESGQDTAAKGRAAGVTAWIIKPFKPESLLKGVQKVLGG